MAEAFSFSRRTYKHLSDRGSRVIGVDEDLSPVWVGVPGGLQFG